MKEKLKNTKGITLIALIITIIILLILAVVSIRLVTNGGILSRTQDAKIQYKVAEIEEALKVKILEEQIVKSTEEPLEDDTVGEYWENTPYINVLDIYCRKIFPTEVPSVSKGNVYEESTGELLIESLIWLPTELINDENLIEAGGSLGELIPLPGLESLGIEINIGKNGYLLEVANTTGTVPSNDIFVFDEDYNVYYIDEQGNIYSSKTKYEVDEIQLGNSYFNPDSLGEEDKKAYEGIYEGALAFTGDAQYASYLARNDMDVYTTINTFMFNGYLYTDFLQADGTIATLNGKPLTNLTLLMTEPDWSTLQIVNDKIQYYMDSSYNMYEYNSETKTIKDKDGNVLDVTDMTTRTASEVVDYNGYQYIERFDGRNVLIGSVPDREELDMATDLADLNVYGLNHKIFEDKSTKTVILPDTIQTLSFLALTRIMTDDDGAVGVFENSTNLEQITIPNHITKMYAKTFANCPNLKTVIMPDSIDEIGQNAFEGCSNVTLQFKDGKAPSGSPWGGTNINITNK